MSVSIDEITAEVQPPATPAAPAAPDAGHDEPETQMRRQSDLLACLARRAARLRAD
ncbi:MAG: hypothetical protein WCF18_09375 [Chthoniobacteraceae bacterium]